MAVCRKSPDNLMYLEQGNFCKAELNKLDKFLPKMIEQIEYYKQTVLEQSIKDYTYLCNQDFQNF